ncbi:YbbR-like domain-containing protein [Flavivirga spongiicola]|uniref:YbbR-like domain-containing protein n=1 Tax=Flavivirga spongiicola TaxID=421621 RepID=A0ABU7Y0E4_9FLAO|nr:YbbR-like domain-containing protein [Flavivirga sp. MEBiC05379]MDO5981180.1 YbbR-like domain-containing protein [Flavivirga sp. MEBiC05379]
MIKKIKSEILTSIKNKRINVFVLFLLFAFIILIFTKLSKEYTNTMAFDIEKINIPEENVILNDSVMLNITLKTHGFKWLRYYISKPKIKIDFRNDVDKKEGGFLWNKSKAYLNNTQFDEQVELLNISPDRLTFRYGVNLVKKVPVKLNATINFEPGYDISDKLVSDPDSIVVIGPDILVSKINLLETEETIFNDVKSNLKERTNLKFPENVSDLKFSDDNVVIKAHVEKFTEGTLKIPVSIINVPKGVRLKYFPKEVNVSYYISLSNFNSVTNKDFKVVCDYTKAIENQSLLVPEFMKFPKTAKNIKINQQRIEFIITK